MISASLTTFVVNNIENSTWHTTDKVIDNSLFYIGSCTKCGVLQIRNQSVNGSSSLLCDTSLENWSALISKKVSL